MDKGEWLEDIKHGDSSSASCMVCVEVCIIIIIISERENNYIGCIKIVIWRLSTKVKQDINDLVRV